MDDVIDRDDLIANVTDVYRTSSGASHLIARDILDMIYNADSIDVVHTKIIQAKIAGINAADMGDQASSDDLKLRTALELVLHWIKTPDYDEYVKRMKGDKRNETY